MSVVDDHRDDQDSPATSPSVTWLPKTRTILLVSLISVGILVSIGAYLLRMESTLVESTALNDATHYSDAISEFRTLYTSEVVERALKKGVSVRHDYYAEESAIPLPATMSMLLGNRITSDQGGSVRLYSDYPFPWRQKERKALDAFELMALERLRSNPTEAVYAFEDFQGRPALRYATADRMRPSCVQCHNQHPDSPKRDWKEGDVRGVLEVIRPMHGEAYEARQALRSSVWFVLVAAGLGLTALALFSFRLRHSTLRANRLAADSLQVSRSLERQIAQREKAEQESAQLEKQMVYAQKLESLGLLAGGVAHDFNNLLTAILGNASLAATKLPQDSPAQQHVDRVHDASLRARDLTDQLLAYAGRASFEQEPVDLGSLVSGIGEILSTVIPPKVTVRYEIEPDLPLIVADRSQMQQVALNLFGNACEAIGAERGDVAVRIGRVEIDSASASMSTMGPPLKPGPHVYLEIEDTGEGMDAQTRSRIFDPFYTTKGPGRGLGLSAILGIVRAHSGALQVDSELGEGTVFRVTFPSVKGLVRTVPEEKPLTLTKRSNEQVLVVDDNDQVRMATAELLENAGWKVLSANGGGEALEKIEATTAGLSAVLLDMVMPNMPGEEVFHRIRALRPEVPILLTSGYQEDNAAEVLCALPRVAFIKKPYRLDRLERVLGELIEKARREDDAGMT
jgi:signal transduction histidine kinase/ActR/RegA family two-component response regulator